MIRQRILLVDDDRNISEILEFNLKNEGFDVESVYSAEDALKLHIPDFNLIVLDVMMGGMSGFKMAEKLRKEHFAIPIIFLTAKDTENDMLTGFSVGADDFIAKPFSLKELIARVKAVLKRSGNWLNSETADHILTVNELTIDFNLMEVSLAGKKIELTKTEFEILSLLARNPDTLFPREKIIETVWKDNPYITERTVDVHIARLRKKLDTYANLIMNRSGFGYRFNTHNL